MKPENLVYSCLVLCWVASCRQEMYDQEHLEPFERSRFFADGLSARLPIPGTVARGHLDLDQHLVRGRVDGRPAESFPFEVDRSVLERGRTRYDIFCSPCHGLAGYGNGAVVRRGFPPPPSFHDDRMREKPVGHYFDVITNGFGVMFDYAPRIEVRDRWAIVAYIRALQWSQSASIEEVPPEVRRELEAQ